MVYRHLLDLLTPGTKHLLYDQGINGRTAARRMRVITSSLSQYNVCSPVVCAFFNTHWVKWKKQPLIMMPGMTCRMALCTATSKSANALDGVNGKFSLDMCSLSRVENLVYTSWLFPVHWWLSWVKGWNALYYNFWDVIPIVVSELVKFIFVYRWNWFHFIYAAIVDMIQYLFDDDSCMVCWVSVYLSAESNWYVV